MSAVTAERLPDRKVDLRRQEELKILGVRIVDALPQHAAIVPLAILKLSYNSTGCHNNHIFLGSRERT
ncbi:hypothetical protein HFN69_34870 [Rhizobium laguerreae]|uniref:hypothetical protein n=1 Tax=Rhizobium laguerreae TaxID=1076926 RepID=UPI001C921869|nr:hypothetical protein [Rhizobium laguerreae]MBY3544931.1 hypothetical protein [Rhizobium laguerreae]MBY3551676.1 hypothetical protein [Rhizobium laguerreae]